MTYALKLFEDGCNSRAYLLKDRIRDRRQLIDAIHAVADGGSTTDPTIVEDLVHSQMNQRDSTLRQLTPHELETLSLVAEGHSNAVIAEKLVVAKRAVEKHANAIFAKLELGDAEHVSRRVKAALLHLSAQQVQASSTKDSVRPPPVAAGPVSACRRPRRPSPRGRRPRSGGAVHGAPDPA